jgi:glycosyltransferase involved in cell wall biosynthesis
MNVVYCAQFRDSSGYGVAARGYLKSLDEYLKHKPGVTLKLYSSVVSQSNKLTTDEISLIEKYEFCNDEDVENMIAQNYIFIWHMPPPLITFGDGRFHPSPNCSPKMLRLIDNAEHNVNLVAWEVDNIPPEWMLDYRYFKPSMIITPSKWNAKVFADKTNLPCEVVPHVIEKLSEKESPIRMPVSLDNKFVVLSISQWTKRKGFDRLIKSFITEFEGNDDAVLLIKTYGSHTHTPELIQQEIKQIRDSILLPMNKKPKSNNIMLIPGFLSNESISWLQKEASVFALFSRGEGFGLPISEALMHENPVIVPREGGHIDYIDEDATFFVDGTWDTCIFDVIPYDCESNWYETTIKSGREQLRKAYNLWKKDPNLLKEMGNKGRKSILDGEYDPYSVGKTFFDALNKLPQEEDVNIYSPIKQKTKDLKKQIKKLDSLEKKLDLLENSYEGETCYILNCGPSLTKSASEALQEKLKDKLVFSVKQAKDYVPGVTDFHFFNCANTPLPDNAFLPEHYRYEKEDPIIVASSNYDLGTRWHKFQKQDIFFKIPIRTEINNEFLCLTKQFENYTINNNITRPCGPGIMYETVIYMAVHLGVKKIVVLGWDLSNQDPKKAKDYKHFYDDQQKMFNKGDVLPWEISITCEASEDLYKWLKTKDIELELCSKESQLYEGIPRVEI